MKYTDFKLNENTIEFHNSIIGNESVLVNGKVVSKKYSFFGTSHSFELNNNKYVLKSKSSKFLGITVILELSENGVVIEEKTMKAYRQAIIWFSIGMFVGAFGSLILKTLK